MEKGLNGLVDFNLYLEIKSYPSLCLLHKERGSQVERATETLFRIGGTIVPMEPY